MKKERNICQKTRTQTILFLLGAAVMLIGSFFSEPLQPHWLFWIGLILFVSSPVYRVLAIKCPTAAAACSIAAVFPSTAPTAERNWMKRPDRKGAFS